MAKDTGKITITLTVGIGILLAVAVIFATSIYLLAPDYRQHLIFIASAVTAAGAIHSAYYLAATLRKQSKDAAKTHSLMLLNNSYEMLGKLNALDAVAVRQFIEESVPDGAAHDDVYEKIKKDEDLRKNVGHLLGFLEDVSLAIQDGHVIESTMYRSLSFIVTYNYKKLGGYIDQSRKEGNDEVLYKELEKLADKWKDGISLTSGKKFS